MTATMNASLGAVRLRDQTTHRHDVDELTWVVDGSCTVEVDRQRWIVDTRQALVIPAGVEHTVIPRPDSIVFPLLFPDGLSGPHDADEERPDVASARLIARTPALELCARALLQPGLAEASALDAARRAAHELVVAAEASDMPALPADSRARTVARAILEHPATHESLDDWAARVHTSGKTLQRHFVKDTGLSFQHWRVNARLALARRRIEHGEGVLTAARAVGYANASAFIAAFRRRYGVTPGTLAVRAPGRGTNAARSRVPLG
ncbi:helix-turn-helix domain-containing protein [Agromyces larvae]|uniref:AraC family transcriptional regulator n=1 Tax=Agromyces larvae TaxID=2929802 RepID=A0ABY4BVN1_9MICO|nr:AraC family transcriptional regulator [Agromyces larvae]UOE43233.1 AraC family transcriptional regulator [Agromyces larvae]